MSSERQEINKRNPWWGEHVFRYETVLGYIKPGDKVLDIACGNGYGAELIHRLVKTDVTGADISEETILSCRKFFPEKNGLKYEVINALNIPYGDNTFDFVTSFETIEHTKDYVQIITEFNRIVKKRGTVFISTPNSTISSPGGKIINPYHAIEFNQEELTKVLANIFSSFEILGQKYSRYEKSGIKNKFSQLIETILYQRGIRKIPLSVQDKLMHMLNGKQMYPDSHDYTLTNVKTEIEKCPTLFAICKKN